MYYKILRINGISYPMETVIQGEGEPDASIEGNVGQLYYDTESEAYWTCKGKEDDDYIWFPLPIDEVIVNGDPKPGTKIGLETTDEDIEIPTMDDIDDLYESKAQINGIATDSYASIHFIKASSGYIKYQDGGITESNTYSVTNFIDVSKFTKIKYLRTGSTSATPLGGMAFYSTNNADGYISGIRSVANRPETGYVDGLNEVIVPNGAKFARFSIYTDVETYGEFEVYGYAIINNQISDLKAQTDKLTELPSENLLAVTDFTEVTASTVSTDTENDTITVTSTSSGTYRCGQTLDTFISQNLVVGESYRLHAKADVISGNPTIVVGIRGTEANVNGLAKSFTLSDGESGFVDFVADKFMKRVTLFATFDTSASASVKFSELWLKEYDVFGKDTEAREEIGGVKERVEDLNKKIESVEIYEFTQGNPIIIENGIGHTDLKDVKINFDPAQGGSSDPSTTNIRPISGRTSLELIASGKNMLEMVTYSGISYNTSTNVAVNLTRRDDRKFIDNGDGSFSLSMPQYQTNAFVFDLIPGVTFHFAATFRTSGTDVGRTYGYMSEDNVVLTATASHGESISVNYDFTGTTQRRKGYVEFTSRAPNSESVITVVLPRLTYGSGNKSYEPYVGSSQCFVPFPDEAGVVYGGTLDLTNGTLISKYALVSLNGTEEWESAGSEESPFFQLSLGEVGTVEDGSGLCSHFVSAEVVGSDTEIGQQVINSSESNAALLCIRLADSSEMDVSAFKEWLSEQASAETPVQVAYKMTEPQQFTVNAQVIPAVEGYNIVLSDGDSVSMGYVRKTEEYINSVISIVEDKLNRVTNGLDDTTEAFNFYDPKISYTQRNYTDTEARSGMTKRDDGTFSCIRYMNQYGQLVLKSLDATKILKAGTYTLSARITIDPEVTLPSNWYEVSMRLGFQNDSESVNMKEERGGTAAATTRVGWVTKTFTLSEDELLAFEIMPKRNVCDASHPCIIDHVMINVGSDLIGYYEGTDSAVDKVVRATIDKLVEAVDGVSGFAPNNIFNGEPYTGIYDYKVPLTAYCALFKNKVNVESFAFFTDPHVLGFADDARNETKKNNYLKRVQKTYNDSPCSFLICGGDWLNNATTMDEACYRLGNLRGIADHLLGGCKLVIGNHDTNYQGKLDPSSANNTGRLDNATLASIMYRDTDTHKAYFSFDGAFAKCYILDTGIEHSTMTAYDWEQVAWLADELLENDTDHAIIFLHIITNKGSVQTNTGNFASLVEAYNGHTTVTLNGIAYDFSGCTGHVDFWVGGHTHSDSTGTLGGIPYMITASNSYSSDIPLIDLVLVDYDNAVVNTVRVGGTGVDRTISLA